MGVSALLVSVAVGTLVVVTTMGFEVASQARTRAVLAAMGVSRRSRAVLVALGALAVAVAGGIVGVVLWLLGTVGLNAVGRFVLGVPVARLHPVLAVYGLAVAVLVGLLAIPYLLVVSLATTSLEVLDA
jgi:putative ABC transport system permease protein